jgi:hypothetical protein
VREIALNADENVSKQSRSIVETAKLAFNLEAVKERSGRRSSTAKVSNGAGASGARSRSAFPERARIQLRKWAKQIAFETEGVSP